MKALLLTAGTRGDVEPFAHLSRELVRDGHDVVLAVPDRSGVDLDGIPVQSLGVDYASIIASQGVSPLQAARAMRTTVRPLMRTLFTTAACAVRDHRPDVVVHHPKVLSAPFTAESLGVPHLVVELVPSVTPTREFPAPGVVTRSLGPLNRLTYFAESASRRMFSRELRAAAREVGQTWDKRSTWSRGSLVAVSPSLLPRPADWPDDVRLTGPWLGEERGRLDETTAAFLAGGEYVYLGFGSMSEGDPEARARALIAGARAASLRILCATGWGGLSVPHDLLGPDLMVVEAAPHGLVLPGAKAAIHHGGAGTVHAVARAGVPQIVVPFFGDQGFWAEVVTAAGLGPRHLDRGHLRPDDVARALERIDQYRPQARRTGSTMAAEQGARHAAGVTAAVADEPRMAR
jgi:sterol 3beta-glucosyltransferase